MKLSDKLIELRKENNWSQEDLAEKLDVSRQAISRWENGSALPDVQNILWLSKLFNVTTDYLLNDDYESDRDIPAVKSANKEAENLYVKKKYYHLVAAICFGSGALCWLFAVANYTSNTMLALSVICMDVCLVNTIIQLFLFFKKR